MSRSRLDLLKRDVQACTLCAAHLEHGVRPVLQVSRTARVLISGQAPGRRVHESGVPFDDPSGDRLREWMGVTREIFYDERRVAILPMGFCYPGTGKSGDLPPRSECAPAWRTGLLELMPSIALTLVIGKYALDWHLDEGRASLTDTVRRWAEFGPGVIPLPHPSPRNNIWLKRNPWFTAEVLPSLRAQVNDALG
jgi:uracil-DNA glycosylase